jgi:uncharacterized membrane protein
MKIGKYNLHIHSISVHFTNSLYPVAVFFLILYKIFQHDSFRLTYYNLLVLASFSAPISFFTGFIEWKQKYKGARVGIFTKKIKYGLVLLGLGSLCALWSFIYPEILLDSGSLHFIFIILNLAIIPFVAYLGYLGGKLIFGGSH